MWDQQWLESLVANVPGAIYRCAYASDWEMQFMSREIEEITGYPAPEFIGNQARTFASVIHEDDRALVEEEVDACVARREPFVLEYRVVRADGRSRWVHEQGKAVLDEEGEVAYLDGAIFDISERKRLEEQLEQLAYNDPLTGLPNRSHFFEHVEVALARARRAETAVALLYLDLDNFKSVNDCYGHAVGDELLREVSRRLTETTRDTDVVARQSGDEFLILMADLSTEQVEPAAVDLAERLRQALGEPGVLSGAEVFVSASIGISVGAREWPGAEELLKRADIAMYRAKHSGRDGYHVGGEEAEGAMERLSLAGRLRRAVELDELELHYQPLVELASGRMLGVEALIRWHHPERGLIMPNEFIPIAERTGAIQQIAEWVAAEACRQGAAWHEDGLDLNVSVNLPARFWRPSAMHSVLGTIESFGVSPDRLMIEISAPVAGKADERNGAMIDALRRRGAQVATGDLGAAHPSLARLSQLAVTALKIDRSFVADAPGEAGVLVGGIIDLAGSLGLRALAEGVESAAQRDFLIARGCELGQGGLFSEPLEAGAVAAYAPPASRSGALAS